MKNVLKLLFQMWGEENLCMRQVFAFMHLYPCSSVMFLLSVRPCGAVRIAERIKNVGDTEANRNGCKLFLFVIYS